METTDKITFTIENQRGLTFFIKISLRIEWNNCNILNFENDIFFLPDGDTNLPTQIKSCTRPAAFLIRRREHFSDLPLLEKT